MGVHRPFDGLGADEDRRSAQACGCQAKKPTAHAPQCDRAARRDPALLHQSGELIFVAALVPQRLIQEGQQVWRAPASEVALAGVDADSAALTSVIDAKDIGEGSIYCRHVWRSPHSRDASHRNVRFPRASHGDPGALPAAHEKGAADCSAAPEGSLEGAGYQRLVTDTP